MDDHWFSMIAAGRELSPLAIQELGDTGFAVIPGPVPPQDLEKLSDAYDSAMAAADLNEIRVGSTTTRIHDFVNRGAEFDRLYVHRPVLEACCCVIGQPFKLSSMHARTVRPHMPAQDLHVDYQENVDGWTMLGYIFMVDEFRGDNGATRFVPGSHRWSATPGGLITDQADDERQIHACGPAGSVIIYHGGVWHGHAANQTDEPRRSIQGGYVRREASAGFDFASRIRPETLARLDPLAKYLLSV